MTEADADAALAASVASEAGRVLLDVRRAGVPGRRLGQDGDRRSNELILARLGAERPGDAVLSEEAADDRRRLAAARVWIVDPLDGTREFAMPDRTDWAVHVALWEAGRQITAAAVAQPALGALYVTGSPAPGSGAAAARSRPLILVSESRPPAFAGSVAGAVGADVQTMGSAGAKAMAVLRGDADAYVHAGGQWEWDSAAPAGVLLSAGFHASRLDGTPLLYNQEHPYLPDLVMCRPDLAGPLLGSLATVLRG